jgi:hypothetical protein
MDRLASLADVLAALEHALAALEQAAAGTRLATLRAESRPYRSRMTWRCRSRR